MRTLKGIEKLFGLMFVNKNIAEPVCFEFKRECLTNYEKPKNKMFKYWVSIQKPNHLSKKEKTHRKRNSIKKNI